jgi:uncharacterized damage-inducible protein DinB
MNKNDIAYLYKYNRWANARTFDDASKLTPQQFTQDLRSSHRSVRDTLAHILAAEWIWLERWNGTSPKALFEPTDFPTIESIKMKLDEVEDGIDRLTSGLTDGSLDNVIAYTNTKGEEWKYTLGHMMQHLANHSSYHRGQVTTMLRQLGADVIPVDLLNFEDEK